MPLTFPISPLTVRLDPPAMHVEVLLAPGAAQVPLDLLVPVLQARCADLELRDVPDAEVLRAALERCRPAVWTEVLAGSAPGATTDGYVELLVPIPVLAHHHHGLASASAASSPASRVARQAVHEGAPLARRHRGVWGSAGLNLRGRQVPARAPREARLPRGMNTFISDDGDELRASCDGEVWLRNLAIDVVPAHVVDGDLDADSAPLRFPAGVFIVGSVCRAHLVAGGDVYVKGDVQESRVVSERASVGVAGRVAGSEERPGVIKAATDVACGSLVHAEVHAGGSVFVAETAGRSLVEAGRDLYVSSLDRGLVEVRLRLGGGVILTAPFALAPVTLSTDRQHVRLALKRDAFIAPHGQPLLFDPCTLVDLSTSGARCRLNRREPRPGALLQLKLDLSDGMDQFFAIARMARWSGPGVVALEFVHISPHDHHRLDMFCMRTLLERRGQGLASPASRGRHGAKAAQE